MAEKAKKSSKFSLKEALALIGKGKDLGELSRARTHRALDAASRRISRQHLSEELRSVRDQLSQSILKKRTPAQMSFIKRVYGKSPASYDGAFRRIEHASSFALSLIDKAQSKLYRGEETFESLGVTADGLQKLREKVWLQEARSYLGQLREKGGCDALQAFQAAGRVAQLVKELKVDLRKLGGHEVEDFVAYLGNCLHSIF